MLAIGLMSGTSLDGLDIALADIEVEPFSCELQAFQSIPYPAEVRQLLLDHQEGRGTAASIAQLHVALARRWSEAVQAFLEERNLKPQDIFVVGSHGQTLYHQAEAQHLLGHLITTTLQAGCGATLAQRLGVPVVSDFRHADMAVGGQGAPLVPYLDWLLFGTSERNVVRLNLGGIANVTVLSAGGGIETVCGFDTGPANMMVDALVMEYTGGKLTYDKDGLIAASGTVDENLLTEMMLHPFIGQVPPKSTGREDFGSSYVKAMAKRGRLEYKLSPEDIIATTTAFTARSIAFNVQHFATKGFVPDVVIPTGGGVRNPTLLRMLEAELQQVFPEVVVEVQEDLVDSIEALAFAVFACRTMKGLPSNVPAVTGAARPVVLGSVHFV